MRGITAAALGAVLLVAAAAAAEPPARVVAAAPARTGELLVANLQTAGLPGDKLLQSMRSGLVSAVAFDLVLLDDDDEAVAGSRVVLQLGFDLWEEIFSVRADDAERRFRTLEDLQRHLAALGALPVAPIVLLAPDQRYRLRIGLQVHPIAPAEQARVEDAIAGVQRPRREGLDQQEAQVSLGRLIQFFYKGGGRDADGQEYLSPWFTRKELGDASH